MPWPKGKIYPPELRHRHRCQHCGKVFLCWRALCQGVHECQKKACLARRATAK
jgi:hypothetical protein